MIKDSTKVAVVRLYDLVVNAMVDIEKYADLDAENKPKEYYSFLVKEYLLNDIPELLKKEMEDLWWKDEDKQIFAETMRLGGLLLAYIQDFKDSNSDDGCDYGDYSDCFRNVVDILKEEFGGYIKVWVNVYERTRNYGGAEEGGWYYDWDECIESKEVHHGEAELIKARLEDEFFGEGDISSVNGGYEIHVRIEELKAQSQDTKRPHYS